MSSPFRHTLPVQMRPGRHARDADVADPVAGLDHVPDGPSFRYQSCAAIEQTGEVTATGAVFLSRYGKSFSWFVACCA
jgi:hypothetical protein